MSRRTRIKFQRNRQSFILAHHSDYASTTTYFPKAFSLLGNDIKFPKPVLPLLLKNKIHFVGKAHIFINQIKNIDLIQQKVILASISLQGYRYQQALWKTNLAVYATSMMCFCIGNIMNSSSYRDKCFPKYKFDDYDSLAKILQQLNLLQTVIINFQDNDFNQAKMKKIDQVISRSNIKTLVLRNLCYFIEPEGIQNYFQLARNNSNVDFKFIWQKFSLISISKKTYHDEEEHNLMSVSMSEQIQS